MRGAQSPAVVAPRGLVLRFVDRLIRGILPAAAACLICTFPVDALATLTVNPEQPLAVGDEYDQPSGSVKCARTLTADVVALDQVIFFNRLDVFLPSGMIYALRRDVEPISGTTIGPGNVQLRVDKRPRPLVLRLNVGDCLQVNFTNLLASSRVDSNQPATRSASMMVDGLSLVGSIASAGAHVGANPSSLVMPGETTAYTWYGSKRGSFLVHSAGAMTGGEGNGGQPDHGLFGVVTVEPAGSVWYRSQVTTAELALATVGAGPGSSPPSLPQIDYDVVYPPGHNFAGRPVLRILDGNEIFHSDLTAIIANIPAGTFPNVTASAPDNNGIVRGRDDPFREITVVYHDENELIQAFPVLETEFFAQSIRDNMAINYGTGGIGAEIISYGADTIETGPFGSPHIPAGNSAKCNDCKYEDAFLSAWAVGEPAMVVERAPAGVGEPSATGAALQALYQDDPSNVYHSYLNDHVKMRVLHGGVTEFHIHHLHAHQWLHTQDSDNSSYYDSQAIGPGSSFTLDVAYNGGGNRNKTPGDSIFHCHFYPHFAQGMWALWRNHDVFEDGTRTLPDAEIPGGALTPAVVPIPGQAMAPLPTTVMPGYPFYIPGVAGHRPPHPPLDTVDDGGLPRHMVVGGTVLDGRRGPFDREALLMDAVALPEDGTDLEKAAMAFHAKRTHPTLTPEGTPATFITNGLPPAPGAPYADPCVDDNGAVTGTPRTIKAAVMQLDAIINKSGWHFPQTRMLSLWGDVASYQAGTRAPEPFFMRAHSGDCIEYYHTNLVPNFYDVDDFQVFTPTDILGQHIHLVKFDVTSSDGSANGWNYEDGTFSPDEVMERIRAINAFGGLDPGTTAVDPTRVTLQAKLHPYFGVLGAQTTIQRWWADPLLNAAGEDRTIRTVFTHDHFGPSTHQQVGLYAGLLIEPAGSTWRDSETGVAMGGRFDGGPTSWRADILTQDPADSHREFMLEFQDFALAYTADGTPVNPPGRVDIGLPFIIGPPPTPMPEAISADDVGTFTINYRNEPLALRLRDPVTNTQAAGKAGDPAFAYSSKTTRADPALNSQPSFYPPLTKGVQPLDPFTPLMRAYEGDKTIVRMLTGATEEGHNFTIHGLRWLHEADDPTSGWRNAEMNGISEHFEFELGPLPRIAGPPRRRKITDFLYQPGASVDDQWNGMWGILREYRGKRGDLLPLPNNLDGKLPWSTHIRSQLKNWQRVCPRTAPWRKFWISAVAAAEVVGVDGVVYNSGHGLHDPTALMYVLDSDLDAAGRLKPGTPIEPLILRANAGDCVKITLRNRLPTVVPDFDGFNMFPMIVNNFNANQVRPSSHVGLHLQLGHYDVGRRDGMNVGLNVHHTQPPGPKKQDYVMYAGSLAVGEDGWVTATPIEFGAINMIPTDPLKQSSKGLVGGLIIEPKGSSWTFPEAGTRATADVFSPRGVFREFVMVTQTDIQMVLPDGTPVPRVGGAPEDAEDSANRALNYRSEPMWTRAGFDPGADFETTNDIDFSDVLSEAGGGVIETPLFTAEVGTPVRFRVLQPQGHPRNQVISIQGHMWRHEPGNPNSNVIGSQGGHGPAMHWDIIPLHGAGGAFGIAGDYLYRDRASFAVDGGTWGVFRVTPKAGALRVQTSLPAYAVYSSPAGDNSLTAAMQSGGDEGSSPALSVLSQVEQNALAQQLLAELLSGRRLSRAAAGAAEMSEIGGNGQSDPTAVP